MTTSRTVKVDYLARVEGEGSLLVKVKGDKVVEAKLGIFEPPRFYEAFLRGRHFSEAPDITARICGICPIAYQMSSINAMEDVLGVSVDPGIRALRRLIYCGEWIESHPLHIYLLHLPDFLGYEDAIQIAKDHPEEVQRGLQLKKLGNDLMIAVGGREIHPINMRVGGFYRVPEKSELEPLGERLKWAIEAAVKTVELAASLKFPDFDVDYEFVSITDPSTYAIENGTFVSNKGLKIPVKEYEEHFEEEHVEHSNALHSKVKARGNYHVGPNARYSLNFKQLSPRAQQAAKSAGLSDTCTNPFKSIIVRSVETLYACEEALKIIENYRKPERAFVDAHPRSGVGFGASEAPRGTLYHRYRLDESGMIQDAKIVPPTAQNLRTIEKDLVAFVEKNLKLSDEKLTWVCEQAVRNYDPCISCATHFLKVKVERE